jgi:hypothetical protein
MVIFLLEFQIQMQELFQKKIKPFNIKMYKNYLKVRYMKKDLLVCLS